ncbi:hypothetical protein EXE25_08365 [Acinetobacter bouvetii]|uniref:Uncharacterized protein n=1 Tax=Acinetobacter bouvetii TaxID=202951 RepID=A0A4Q7AUJ8_9GAMM|nr:polysaccharide biosynthesis C-terminal domain-containing protein [Acinetobacter bouvetii]RZG67122.1 hypothetical protein EXE25_08365 [Acinetobacter bouvetii]
MQISKFLGVGATEVIAKILSWLSLAIIPFFATPEKYGEIVLYYSIIVFFMPVYLFGQDRLILKNNPEKELLSSFIFSIILFSGLSTVLYFFDYFLASLAGLALALNKIYLTFLRSKEDFLKYSLNRIFYSILRFLLVFIIVYQFYTLNNYIIAEFLAAIVLTLGAFVGKINFRFKDNFKFKERFIHGFPLMLHGISLFGVALIDRFILEKYTDLKTVGNYSFLYIFASGLVFLYSIVSVFQEKKIYKSESYNILLFNVKRTLTYMFAIGSLGSILSFFVYFILLNFKLVNGYQAYYVELVVLILSHLILPVYLISNYIMIQNNKQKLLLFCSMFSFIINTIFNFLFIPNFGLVGAVWATLIANLFLVVLSAYLSFRIMQSRRIQ